MCQKKGYNIFFELQAFLSILLLLGSCSGKDNFYSNVHVKDTFFEGEIKVEKIEKLGKYKLSIHNVLTGESDCIYTPYDIFQIDFGDVNHDGKTDVCLGIIKPTPFDTIFKKRLFIFQIDKDFIRPLWLGSRLVNPLEQFKVCKADNRTTIKSLERTTMNLYCINEYQWESFGMSFLNKYKDSLTYSNAKRIFNNL